MNQCLCSKRYWYACSCSANINTETSLTTAKGLTNIQIFDAMENINKDYSEFYTEQRSIITNINENKQNIKRYIIINKKLNPKINLQDINLACEEHIEFEKGKYEEFKLYQLAKEKINLAKLFLMKKELKYEKELEAARIIAEVIKRMDDKRNAVESTIFSRRSMNVRESFAGGLNIRDMDTGNQNLRNTFYSPNARIGVDKQALGPKVALKMPFRSFVSNEDFNVNDFNERECVTFRKSTVVERSRVPEHFNYRNTLNYQFSNLSLSPAKPKSPVEPSIIVYSNYLITVINNKIVSYDINLNKFEDNIKSDLLFYDSSSYAQISPGEYFYLENTRDPNANLNNFYLINLNTNLITVHQSPNILRYNVGCLGYCENVVYVFGGLNKENQALKESECFSIDTGMWKRIESLPSPIVWASTVTQGKFIFICGIPSSRIMVYDTEKNCYYTENHERALQIDKLYGKQVAFIFGFNDKVICSLGGKLFKGPNLWQQITVNANLEAATLMPRTWTQHGNYTYITLDNKKIYQFSEETKSIIAIADFSTRKTAIDLASPQKK